MPSELPQIPPLTSLLPFQFTHSPVLQLLLAQPISQSEFWSKYGVMRHKEALVKYKCITAITCSLCTLHKHKILLQKSVLFAAQALEGGFFFFFLPFRLEEGWQAAFPGAGTVQSN